MDTQGRQRGSCATFGPKCIPQSTKSWVPSKTKTPPLWCLHISSKPRRKTQFTPIQGVRAICAPPRSGRFDRTAGPRGQLAAHVANAQFLRGALGGVRRVGSRGDLGSCEKCWSSLVKRKRQSPLGELILQPRKTKETDGKGHIFGQLILQNRGQ